MAVLRSRQEDLSLADALRRRIERRRLRLERLEGRAAEAGTGHHGDAGGWLEEAGRA
jgi:hypothetical protein